MPEDRTPEQIAATIFDSISDGVFTTDRDCRITSFNRAAERISGFSRADAVGRFCFDIFRTELCHQECALRSTLKHREQIENVRVSIITRDGRRVPIRVTTEVLRDGAGEVVGAVEFFRDISEVENLERHYEGLEPLGRLGFGGRMAKAVTTNPNSR